MPTKNGYAAMSKKRAEKRHAGTVVRRKLDDYETPERHTLQLLERVKFKGKTITEPFAGSGRMARVLRAAGHKVLTADIKTGQNFRNRTSPISGDCVSNPPYRDGMADFACAHALKLTAGKVAMLMEGKFLYGQARAESLFLRTPPELIIHVPERIYFLTAGKPIDSQFFNHCWIVWPDKKTRDRGGYPTLTVWATSPDVGEFG